MIETYIEKPREIKAIQWTGKNKKEVLEFCPVAHVSYNNVLTMLVSEGPSRLLEGDYIIKKESGSYTYSRPNVFNIKYEKK